MPATNIERLITVLHQAGVEIVIQSAWIETS
jgi:hypothetical protein